MSASGVVRMTGSARALALIVCAAAAWCLVLTAVRYVDRPFRFDEIEWPGQARAIVARGVPRETFAEERVDRPNGYYGYDAKYGMWHPPLYHYALAAALVTFGDHTWAYRSVGLVCLAVSLFAIGMLSATGGTEGRWLRVGLPIALPLLSPFVTEGVLFLDIDNTTLLASMALLMWRFLRPGDPYTPRRTLELAGWLLLTLCSKLTTPFVLMASLMLYAALGARPGRGVRAIAAAAAAAVIAFAAIYWTYCTLLSYPPWFMFAVSYAGKHDLYSSLKPLKTMLFAVRWHVVWTSPILVMLLCVATAIRVGQYVRTRVSDAADLLLIFAWATFGCYAIVGGMWGKYALPAAVFGAAAAGRVLSESWPSLVVRSRSGIALLVVVVASACAMLPVPYARPGGTDSTRHVLELAFDARNISALAIAAMAGIFAVVAAGRWLCGSAKPAAAAASLALMLAAASAVTTSRVVLGQYDRGPFRPYFDTGFVATADVLNRSFSAGTLILAPKDIGYYFHGRTVALDALSTRGNAAVVAAASRPDVRAVVDSAKYPTADPRLFEALPLARIEAIGDFRIYVKQP